MKLFHALSKLDLIPKSKLLEFYPPFLFMGVKVKSVSPDQRTMHVTVPLRWYGKNMYGAMFGGFICAVADPLPALLCGRHFPGVEMWTKSNNVEFLKPGRGTLDAVIELTERDIKAIERQLDEAGKAVHTIEFFFRDKHKHDIARVHNTIYLRRPKSSAAAGAERL